MILRKATARDRLLRRIHKHAGMVEVGVWQGDFSADMLRRNPARLHLVDPWRFVEGRALYGRVNGQPAMDAIAADVARRFARQARTGQVLIHRTDSLSAAEAAALFGLQFDFVYVDGDHRYDAVLADLRAWAPLVRPGGILAGDDFGEDGCWWGDGVTRAVQDFAAERDWDYEVDGTQFTFTVDDGAPQQVR